MALYILNLEIMECIHKYFGDFYNFICIVIQDESEKSKTCEGFFEALYVAADKPNEGRHHTMTLIQVAVRIELTAPTN